jgi:hypothetical protein
MTSDVLPTWLPDRRIVVSQLATGIIDYFQQIQSPEPFRLPYPANLQTALDKLTLLAWHQGVAPPSSVMELLRWAEAPFDDWKVTIADADVDPEESLLSYGRPNATCEELGSLRGDVEGEIRENELIAAVRDKARAANAPDSYVAFRQLLIERPSISALELDEQLACPVLALLADEVRRAYVEASLEAIADGVVRTCGGCGGLRLPLDDDRTWSCVDLTCPAPHSVGPEHPAAEGVWWLRREMRTFIVAPGRAELRIAKAAERLGVTVQLWPDFDASDLVLFATRPWAVDVKAWRNPARLAHRLRQRPFRPPAGTDRAFIVIAKEQVKGQQRYIERLRRACPDLRPGQPVVAVSEDEFLRAVEQRQKEES